MARELHTKRLTDDRKAARAEVVRRTFSFLRIRNFRLYFFGQMVSLPGTWMQGVAQAWLVLRLTGSGTALGLVVALQFLPVLLFAPLGGLVADRLPKRRVLFVTQSTAGLLAAVLGLTVATGVAAAPVADRPGGCGRQPRRAHLGGRGGTDPRGRGRRPRPRRRGQHLLPRPGEHDPPARHPAGDAGAGHVAVGGGVPRLDAHRRPDHRLDRRARRSALWAPRRRCRGRPGRRLRLPQPGPHRPAGDRPERAGPLGAAERGAAGCRQSRGGQLTQAPPARRATVCTAW